tara:strand:+ start:516 stop:1577 length:1062 start_codon:yes stop_codon:yes gene_type:complete
MINIISPINPLGYGVAGLNIVKELSKLTQVSLFPMGQISGLNNAQDAEVVKKCIANSRMPSFTDACVRIWHQNDMSQFVGNGKRIGFPFFELDNFSDIEKHHLQFPDQIIVSSKWAKEVVVNSCNLTNVSVVPLGVDSSIFTPHENTEEKTIFFNCGKWEYRKGHDIIPLLFNNAFTEQDNVELWMMTQNPFLSKEQSEAWSKIYKKSKLGSKIKLVDRVNTHKEVYNIMRNVDCGLFPSRAEGWNLELLEMMSCGKNVIATDYSAHTEFCNHDNALLISVDEKETAKDNIWFHGDVGQWAKLGRNQMDQAIQHMRDVHNKKQNGHLQVNKSGIDTARYFSWHNTAKGILKNV